MELKDWKDDVWVLCDGLQEAGHCAECNELQERVENPLPARG